MNFKDQGIILSIRKYSEYSLIIKILSHNHGICCGFVPFAHKSVKNSYLYQIGNLTEFTWRAKSMDSLGSFKIELIKSFLAEILSSHLKLKCLTNIVDIIEDNILEKEPHQELFISFLDLLNNLKQKDNIFLGNYIKLEIELLQILGYGIDLSKCAATGQKNNLYFVSPKSGRAVSKEAGEKYHNKLLKLPQFLIKKNLDSVNINKDDLLNGLRLSGFFINKYLNKGENSDIENTRNKLVGLAEKLSIIDQEQSLR